MQASPRKEPKRTFEMKLRQVIPSLLLVVAVAHLTAACKRYKIRVVKVENCAGAAAVVTIDPKFTLQLNPNCELVPDGCVLNKAFASAVSTYKVQKDGVVMHQGSMDLCAAAGGASGEVKDLLKLFGAPSSCPVAEGRICSNDHRIDLSKYRSMLSLAKGKILLQSQIEHDVGKSCFNIEVEIARG